MHYERKVKIVLHGYLKDLYPDQIELSGHSVAEVINGFCRQTKAFNVAAGEEKHCMHVVGFDTEDSLYLPIPSNVDTLHLVPAMIGGKKGGFFKIVVGAVIIAAAIWSGGTAFGAMTLFAGGSTISSMLFSFGVSLVLGGLLEMISPTPKIDKGGFTQSGTDPEASKYLGANQNTVKIGTRIPLLYGKHIAYGHYVSFDVDAVDVSV